MLHTGDLEVSRGKTNLVTKLLQSAVFGKALFFLSSPKDAAKKSYKTEHTGAMQLVGFLFIVWSSHASKFSKDASPDAKATLTDCGLANLWNIPFLGYY